MGVLRFRRNNRRTVLLCLLTFLYRQIRPRSPFRPGAVIEGLRWFAERVEGEPQRGCGDTGTAGGDDGLTEIDASTNKYFLQPLGRHEAPVLDDRGGGYVERTGHVTGGQSRPRL